MFMLHIEAPFDPRADIPAQNGPMCAACRGLARGGSSEATGLLGMNPPLARRSRPVFRKMLRGLHTKV